MFLEDLDQLVAFDDFLLQEPLRHLVQRLPLPRQKFAHSAVLFIDDAPDLPVDLLQCLLAVPALFRISHLVHSQHVAPARLVRERPQRFAHPIFEDHAAGQFGDAAQVVLRSGGDLIEDDLFRYATAQQNGDAVE